MSELPEDDERVQKALKVLMSQMAGFIGQPMTGDTLELIRIAIYCARTDFKKKYGHEFPDIAPLVLPQSQFVAWFRRDLDNEEIRIKVLNLLREFHVKRIPVSEFELARAMRLTWPGYNPDAAGDIEFYRQAKQVKMVN